MNRCCYEYHDKSVDLIDEWLRQAAKSDDRSVTHWQAIRDQAALMARIAGGEPCPWHARSDAESGHTAPDFLWTIALILFIVVMLRMLGAL